MASRRGFTLLEVLVALTVSGVVLLTVHQLVVAMTSYLDDVRRSSRTHSAEMNGRRWLRSALASTMSPTDSFPFAGTNVSLTFSARVRQAGGWYELERILIDLQGRDLVVQRSLSGRLVLASQIESMTIDYWLDGESSRPWLRGWLSYGTMPHFVRFRLKRIDRSTVDTLVLMIRGRQ